jgi:hypothetical protein
MGGREHEAEAHLVDTGGDSRRVQVDSRAQRLQQIG